MPSPKRFLISLSIINCKTECVKTTICSGTNETFNYHFNRVLHVLFYQGIVPRVYNQRSSPDKYSFWEHLCLLRVAYTSHRDISVSINYRTVFLCLLGNYKARLNSKRPGHGEEDEGWT